MNCEGVQDREGGEHMNSNAIIKYYGYAPEVVNAPGIYLGFWPNEDGVFNGLAKLPELLDRKQKVRIVFDYDPDFPSAMIQVRGVLPVQKLW